VTFGSCLSELLPWSIACVCCCAVVGRCRGAKSAQKCDSFEVFRSVGGVAAAGRSEGALVWTGCTRGWLTPTGGLSFDGAEVPPPTPISIPSGRLFARLTQRESRRISIGECSDTTRTRWRPASGSSRAVDDEEPASGRRGDHVPPARCNASSSYGRVVSTFDASNTSPLRFWVRSVTLIIKRATLTPILL
jgi:hypothetical protein